MSSPLIELPRIIGHRGAARHAPENTLAGFQVAAELGATWVEFDVRLTGDGVLVLMHDATVDRTTNGSGAVAAMRQGELRQLDAGAWFDRRFAGETVPTLAEALAVIHELGMTPNIEIKPNPGQARRTGRAVGIALKTLWPSDRPQPLVSSFQLRSLYGLRKIRPDLPIGLNVWQRAHYQWSFGAKLLGCASVHFSHQHVTDAQISSVKGRGRKVACYTVNDPQMAQALFARGVDAVFTDVPDLILPVA